jgi:hypothetical protein
VTYLFALIGFLRRLIGPLTGFLWARDRQRAKDAEAAVRASDRGRQGATEAKGKLKNGKTPDQVVRENDASWDD